MTSQDDPCTHVSHAANRQENISETEQNLNLTVITMVGILNLLQVYQLGYWAIQSLVQYSPCKIQPVWVEGLSRLSHHKESVLLVFLGLSTQQSCTNFLSNGHLSLYLCIVFA